MNNNRWLIVALVVVGVAGALVRLQQSATFKGPGPDERAYAHYVGAIGKAGLGAYPQLVADYIEYQRRPESQAILPPLRLTFIVAACAWHSIAGSDPLSSVNAIARIFSVLMLGLSCAFAWRLGGRISGVAVLALVSFAPMQIYMSQRALIDGVFAVWALLALWALWEVLQAPGSRRWLYLYGIALAGLVATKENAFFVFVALCGLLVANLWLRFGRADWKTYGATIIGPALGVLLLMIAAGGITNLVEAYRANVAKSMVLPYALLTGDGPWHRYLLDLLTVDPLIVLLAVGAILSLSRRDRPAIFLTLFVVISYAIMCQVRYGMNLRYANMWDMPLRWLAFWQLCKITEPFAPRARTLLLTGAVAALCLLGWYQYNLLFVKGGIYDPVPSSLGRALNTLKE